MRTDLSFSGLTIEQIGEKLKKLPYQDLVDLLVVYQCPACDLAGRIAQAEGLKVPKKNESIEQIALCQMVYSQNRIADAIIQSNKVIVGVLEDIQNGIDRIADK